MTLKKRYKQSLIFTILLVAAVLPWPLRVWYGEIYWRVNRKPYSGKFYAIIESFLFN
jgi:hypothetical protein